MADQTLNNICKTGAFPNVHIYHICGLPWAATNDVAFAKWIAQTGTDQTDLRANMFGKDSLNVEVLPILSVDLGGQSINYSENKGINVSGWSVKISAENSGHVWNNYTSMEQWGLIGLDWQPNENTDGAGSAMIVDDVVPNLASSNSVFLKWAKNKNEGQLWQWMFNHWNGSSFDEDLYFYVGSSCIRPVLEPVDDTSADYYVIGCEAGKLNSPAEDILALSNGQNIMLSNYPQGIEGLTANLYSVMFKNDTLISGVDPFFMRTGKVKNNATQDNSGNWSLSMGGFTDQFKFKNTIGSYQGNLANVYRFNKKDFISDSGTGNEYHMPFMWARELTRDSAGDNDPYNDMLELSTDYKEFTSVSEMIDYAVDLLNGSSNLSLVYSKTDDNDIVADLSSADVTAGKSISYVYLTGLLPYVAGVGKTITADNYEHYLAGNTDPINSNIASFSTTEYTSSNSSDCGLASFFLSGTGEFNPPIRDVTGTKVYVPAKPMDYFIQNDLSAGSIRRGFTDPTLYEKGETSYIPNDSLGDQNLTILTSALSDIELQVGMSVQFGSFSDDTTGLSVYGDVSAISGNEITFLFNVLFGCPMSMYTNSTIPDELENGFIYSYAINDYCRVSGSTIDEIRSMFNGDLFAIKDRESIKLSSASDLFKGVLGDPDTDVGFNIGAIKTDIKNLFDRGEDNFIPMVDWDRFEELVDENKIEGCTYKYTPDSNGVDMLALLAGVCLTYNIQQIWDYNPDYRCWWLTFENFGDGNGTTAALDGRSLTTLDIATNDLTAQTGGSWYYNKLSAEYPKTSGNKVKISYQLTDGRKGHSLHDKVLTIDDKVTVMPVDSIDQQNDIIENFIAMVRLFSQIVYKQKFTINTRKTALLGVGRWSTIEWSPIQNRETGRRNDGALIGQVQSMNINLSSSLISIDVLSQPNNKEGIAPSLYSVTVAKSGNTVTLSDLSTDPADNNFGDVDKPLTGLAYFGCISNESGVLVDRECDCAGYRVTIFERNPTDGKLYFDPSNAYASQNVWRGTMDKITVADLGATVDIELDGNGTAFDITKDYVVTFADRADENLQDCQTDYYGWLANTDNQVVLSDDSTKRGITVGS